MSLSVKKIATAFMAVALAAAPETLLGQSMTAKPTGNPLIIKSDDPDGDAGQYADGTHHLGFVIRVGSTESEELVNRIANAYLKLAKDAGADESRVYIGNIRNKAPRTMAAIYLGNTVFTSPSGNEIFDPAVLVSYIPDAVKKANAIKL